MEFFSRRCPPTGPIHQWSSGQQGWSWVQHATQECCWISEAPGDDKRQAAGFSVLSLIPSIYWVAMFNSLEEEFVVLFKSGLWGFPGRSDGKESACNAGDRGLIPRLGRSSGEENGYPLWYSCLENSMAGYSRNSLAGYSPWGRKESDTTATNTFGGYLKEKKPKFSSWKHSFLLKAHLPHLGLNRDGGRG